MGTVARIRGLAAVGRKGRPNLLHRRTSTPRRNRGRSRDHVPAGARRGAHSGTGDPRPRLRRRRGRPALPGTTFDRRPGTPGKYSPRPALEGTVEPLRDLARIRVRTERRFIPVKPEGPPIMYLEFIVNATVEIRDRVK